MSRVDVVTWQERAACADVDVELFFPVKEADPALEAKEVCARCPVLAECLDESLAKRHAYGVWGGLTERERRSLLRKTTGTGRTATETQHGTSAMYRKHYRNGEKPCEPCRVAYNRDHTAEQQDRRSKASA